MATLAPHIEDSVLNNIRYSICSDVGRRRVENQDSVSVFEVGKDILFIVADGMGGVKGGAVASQLAVRIFTEYIEGRNSLTVEDLATAAIQANSAIFDRGVEQPELAGMGTTVAGLYFHDSELFVLNVGDSRAYRIRKGGIEQLTEDHTLVSELLKSGAITEGQVENHPISHMLTRSLGPTPLVEVDCWPCPSNPMNGDKYLICSDGLYNMVDNQEILNIFNSTPTEDVAQALVDLANKHGGVDNITCIAIEFGINIGKKQRELDAEGLSVVDDLEGDSANDTFEGTLEDEPIQQSENLANEITHADAQTTEKLDQTLSDEESFNIPEEKTSYSEEGAFLRNELNNSESIFSGSLLENAAQIEREVYKKNSRRYFINLIGLFCIVCVVVAYMAYSKNTFSTTSTIMAALSASYENDDMSDNEKDISDNNIALNVTPQEVLPLQQENDLPEKIETTKEYDADTLQSLDENISNETEVIISEDEIVSKPEPQLVLDEDISNETEVPAPKEDSEVVVPKEDVEKDDGEIAVPKETAAKKPEPQLEVTALELAATEIVQETYGAGGLSAPLTKVLGRENIGLLESKGEVDALQKRIERIDERLASSEAPIRDDTFNLKQEESEIANLEMKLKELKKEGKLQENKNVIWVGRGKRYAKEHKVYQMVSEIAPFSPEVDKIWRELNAVSYKVQQETEMAYYNPNDATQQEKVVFAVREYNDKLKEAEPIVVAAIEKERAATAERLAEITSMKIYLENELEDRRLLLNYAKAVLSNASKDKAVLKEALLSHRSSLLTKQKELSFTFNKIIALPSFVVSFAIKVFES